MPDRTQLVIAALKRHPELDPQAVLGVSRQEGLSGGIGDGGHAFGPFQLNNAGGVITGKFQGQTPEQINQWAWSPAGIDYALQGISKVAAGQHGDQAVNSIVRNFERPADPNGEVQRALGGQQVSQFGGGAAPRTPSVAGAPAADSRSAFVTGLLGAISPTGQVTDPSALVQAMQQRRGATASAPALASAGPQPATHKGGIAELLQEGTGGPTHSTGPHIHAAFTDPRLELAAITWAQQHGLHVGENPYVGGVAPVHAPNSYHTRTFPGLYSGRKLGQAIDVSGGNTSGFYQWLAGQR